MFGTTRCCRLVLIAMLLGLVSCGISEFPNGGSTWTGVSQTDGDREQQRLALSCHHAHATPHVVTNRAARTALAVRFSAEGENHQASA